MDVILHVGDAKCGSSAIQASLNRAKGDLLEQGILYHPPPRTDSHACYITMLGGKTRGDNDKLLDLARTNILETGELIRRHAPRHLILSSEYFFMAPPRALLALLEDIGCAPSAPCHVMAFLRHPAPLYLSTVQQMLKASHVFPLPQSYLHDISAILRWRQEPRCAGLSLRRFDRARLVGGSVVPEFQEYLRKITGRTDIELPDTVENVSISAEQTILLQQFRRDFLADRKDQFHLQSNRLIQVFERLNAAFGRVGTRASLRPEVRACLIDRHLSILQRLDDQFPDLEIIASEEVPQLTWAQATAEWTADVGSILESHDPDVVSRLRLLVPEYNGDLKGGDVSAALEALKGLGLPVRSNAVFRDCLRQSGMREAALAVQKTLPADAG